MANVAEIGYARPLEGFTEALGGAETFLQLQAQLARVAPTDRPVLLVGERGTGKELAAARVHYLSGRWGGPFVKLNCASLSPTVLESELFGHEAGAFTGAVRRRAGRFEAAHEGTLFLDEIGLMPLAVQEKVLRVVEYGTFERVGASAPVSVNVRVVTATNTDLPAAVAAGKFKADLLDRLAFQVLFLPPLRLRPGDVELLTFHFARRFAAEIRLATVPRFTERAYAQLRAHPWPGNVRELRNVVERAVYLADGPEIETVCLDPFVPPFEIRLERAVDVPPSPAERSASPVSPCREVSPGTPSLPVDLAQETAALEVRLLQAALSAARYGQREAAGLLGLSYDAFRGLYRKHRSLLQGEGGTPAKGSP